MELDQLLKIEEGVESFMKFLKTEFSDENLEFWLECQQLKKMTNNKMIRKYAHEVYRKFISIDGSKTINIDSETMKIINKNLQNPNGNVFEPAERHVFELMKNDSYTRFIQSRFYLEFISVQQQQETPSQITNSNSSNSSSNSNRKRKSTQNSLCCDCVQKSTNETIIRPKSCAKKFVYNQFIKVILPDGTHDYASVMQNATVDSVIRNILAKNSMETVTKFRIISIQDNKEIEPTRNIASLVLTDIRIERIVTFSIHFPEGYRIQLETNANKLAYYIIQIIINRFGISFEEIELTSENGIPLNRNSLLKSTIILDNSVIYVNYLSPLRTYIDMVDFHDLNMSDDEDGITIKSVKFIKQQKLNCQSISVDCKNYPLEPSNRITKQESKNIKSNEPVYENVENDFENVDLGNLSFSNEQKTEEFLTNMMINPDGRKFNFICKTPSKPNKFLSNNDDDKKNLHHARLAFIEEDPEEHFYENQDFIKQQQQQQILSKKENPPLPTTNTSPFTEYLRKQTSEIYSRMNQTQIPKVNTVQTISNPLPDLISAHRQMKTLSRFHKII